MGKKQGIIILAVILLVLTSANAYAASTGVRPGDYLYITGSPAMVNGRTPPTYTYTSVVVSDSGCIYTGLQQPYKGSSISYADRVAVHYNLHGKPGTIHLTPGKYFKGLEINILVPEGYKGSLANNIHGNGTHLLATFYINGNAVPVAYKLPASIVVAWRLVQGLGEGWFIGINGPAQALTLDLTGVKVASVKGTCTAGSTSTTTSTTTQAVQQEEGSGVIQNIALNQQAKWVVGLGLAIAVIAGITVLASKK